VPSPSRPKKYLQGAFVHEPLGLRGKNECLLLEDLQKAVCGRKDSQMRPIAPITYGLVDRGLQLLSPRRPHRAQPRGHLKLFQAVVPAARESAVWHVV